jgi:hypothetical protein
MAPFMVAPVVLKLLSSMRTLILPLMGFIFGRSGTDALILTQQRGRLMQQHHLRGLLSSFCLEITRCGCAESAQVQVPYLLAGYACEHGLDVTQRTYLSHQQYWALFSSLGITVLVHCNDSGCAAWVMSAVGYLPGWVFLILADWLQCRVEHNAPDA